MKSPMKSPTLSLSVLSAILTTALLSSSCRESDYLYYVKPDQRSFVIDSRPIKEMQGTDKVDILWIIDNSGSMDSYQREVIQNTEDFMKEFTQKSQLKWRMGLISSDTYDVPYVGFSSLNRLDYQTADPVSIFQSAVSALGTSGAGIEKFFEPIQKHLTSYPDFMRPGAVLALIFVTDAPEQSSMSPDTFTQWLGAVRGNLKNVLSYGAFAANDLPCRPGLGEENWTYAGSDYEVLFNLTHGMYFPICQDFGQSLIDVAKDIVKRVERPTIYLNARPELSTIEVYYQGNLLPGGPQEEGGFWVYDYERNAIVLHDLSFAPGDQESITVRFLPAR